MTPSRQPIGQRVLSFETIDSTNNHALSFADDPSQHGLVVLAGAQTAGRGQHGRSWQASAGSSVLLSALIFPPAALRRPVLLTAWAAVSVCELIEEIGLQAKIKWPNDILIDGRKVCGILIEQRQSKPDCVATVVGIGLNVKQDASSFAEAGLPDAGSLAMFATALGAGLPTPPHGHAIDACPKLAARLIQKLDGVYRKLEQADHQTVERRWRDRLGLQGREVILEGTKQPYRGRLHHVSFQNLEIETGPGNLLTIPPEEVRHVLVTDSGP